MTFEALLNDEDEAEFDFTTAGFENARKRAGFAGDFDGDVSILEEEEEDDEADEGAEEEGDDE